MPKNTVWVTAELMKPLHSFFVTRTLARWQLRELSPHPYLLPTILISTHPFPFTVITNIPADPLTHAQIASNIHCVVFFKCLCSVDFEPRLPWAPGGDLRGPVVWPPIRHILPAATERQALSAQHSVRFNTHQHTSQVLIPSRSRWSPACLRLLSYRASVWKKILWQHFKTCSWATW